jgi:hypothetical protein
MRKLRPNNEEENRRKTNHNSFGRHMIKLAAHGNEEKGGGHPTFSMGPPLSWMRSPLSIWNFFWVSLNLR